MISHELLRDEGILIVTPEGPLEAADFEAIGLEVGPYIEEKGGLPGLMIYVESFPGWDSFAALLSHLRFVRDHQRQIKRVAAVTDSRFLGIMPGVVDRFVSAEVRHFAYSDRDAALSWLREGPGAAPTEG